LLIQTLDIAASIHHVEQELQLLEPVDVHHAQTITESLMICNNAEDHNVTEEEKLSLLMETANHARLFRLLLETILDVCLHNAELDKS
jgi:hypothetical protein